MNTTITICAALILMWFASMITTISNKLTGSDDVFMRWVFTLPLAIIVFVLIEKFNKK